MGLHSIDGDIHFGGNGFVRLSIKNNIGNHPTGMLRKLSDRNMQLGTDAVSYTHLTLPTKLEV